jgi:hypothetical protein
MATTVQVTLPTLPRRVLLAGASISLLYITMT